MGFLQNPILTNGNFLVTPEGGIAVKLINKTGSPSVKGMVVKNSPNTTNAVELTDIAGAGLYMPIGVFYENGKIDGDYCWVVISGIAYVYITIGLAVDLGAGLRTSATTAGTTHQFTPTPADDEHFREIGHTLESKTIADANRLVRAVLHFN